ncbi:MAG: MmgE/PrpD family protein [Burkholderiales bacterium]
MKPHPNASVSPLMRRLGAYAARAPRAPLPAPVAEKTKHHLLDTLAAMVSGSRLPPGKIAISFAKTLGGAKEAAVVGSAIVTSAANAALANGMLAHADETDDSHAASQTHPGCGVVAAALAMAERERAGGTALLRAIALGYDLCCRLTQSLGAMRFRAEGHSTHSFGPAFGAAAAAGALARLDERRMRYLFSYAAQQASGVSCWMRDEEHIEKAFDFGGMPARNGVAAAAMVAHGFTGVEDVFSGERSFFAVHRAADPDELARELGERYEIMNADIKRWSVGSPIQAPLDSLLELMRAHRIRPADVERLVVRVSRQGANTTHDRDMPDICMEHLCALMLLDGTVSFRSSHDRKRMRDRGVLALRRRIELQADEALTRVMPLRQGIVEIRLKDGCELRHHTQAVRGTPANPMTRAEVEGKCQDLMAPVIGRTRSRKVCDAVWNLETIRDVGKLSPLLRA